MPGPTKKQIQAITQVATCQLCPLVEKCKAPVPMTHKFSQTSSRPSVSAPPRRTNGQAEESSSRSTPSAEFIVVGEAPGRLEDYTGTPFVGNAGQRLRKSLRNVGLDPDAGWYMNAVSCWPRGTPEDTHIRQCHDNLKAQLDAAPPMQVLVCGRTALRALVPNAKLTDVVQHRFRWIPIHGKVLYPIFHPSAILRKHSKQAIELWERELQEFAIGVMHPSSSNPCYRTECVYCGKITWDGEPTCRTKDHQAKWKRDHKWMHPIPPQLGLFDVE